MHQVHQVHLVYNSVSMSRVSVRCFQWILNSTMAEEEGITCVIGCLAPFDSLTL